VATTRTEDGPK